MYAAATIVVAKVLFSTDELHGLNGALSRVVVREKVYTRKCLT